MVNDRKKIAENYLSTLFPTNLISILVVLYNIIFPDYVHNYIMLLFFLKVRNVFNFYDQIHKLARLRRRTKAIVRLVALALFVFTLAHLIATVCFFISMYALKSHPNWHS
jgi:hypothetical protein